MVQNLLQLIAYKGYGRYLTATNQTLNINRINHIIIFIHTSLLPSLVLQEFKWNQVSSLVPINTQMNPSSTHQQVQEIVEKTLCRIIKHPVVSYQLHLIASRKDGLTVKYPTSMERYIWTIVNKDKNKNILLHLQLLNSIKYIKLILFLEICRSFMEVLLHSSKKCCNLSVQRQTKCGRGKFFKGFE